MGAITQLAIEKLILADSDGAILMTDAEDKLLALENFQGAMTKVEVEALPDPVNGWWAIATDEGLMVYEGGEWKVKGGGEDVPQDYYEFIDALTGNTVRFSIRSGSLVVTDTTTESTSEIDLGGITVDPGLLFPINVPHPIYQDVAGHWTCPTGTSGYNDAGVISQEYIDSPGQWFVVPNFVPNDAQRRIQGFGLIDEAIIDGNAPSGVQNWAGGSIGGANLMGMFYESSGMYSWTNGSRNEDTPGGAGQTLASGISNANQKLLSLAQHSSVATGSVSYSQIRVGVDTDEKLKVQWYLPQEAIDDGTVSTGTAGWKDIFRSNANTPAGTKYRFKWVGYSVGSELSSLPHVIGVSSVNQQYAASGNAYYVVNGISSGDKAAAALVMAESTDSFGNVLTIVKYLETFSFDGTETSIDQVSYTEATIATKSPLFVTYPNSTKGEIEDMMNALSAFQGLRANVCDQVLKRVVAYYLNENLSTADEATVLTAFNTAKGYAEGGFLKSTRTAVAAITVTALIPQVLIDELLEELDLGLRIFPR